MGRPQAKRRQLGIVVAAGLVSALVLPAPAVASGAPDKTETVYVQTDPSGHVTKVTSDVLLANEARTDALPDRTRLVDLSPSDEDQSYVMAQDGALTWTTGGKQVSYRGTSDEKPPVDVRISYQLDGRSVAPEELAGASGHLVMRVDYQNNSSSRRSVSGEERLVSTPFVCVTLVSLDSDVAKNVQVTNGSVMEDKGGCAVVGYAVPGLEESLGSDLDDLELDLDLPTYVQVEADVTDFALDPVRTFVTAEPLSELDASELEGEGLGGSTDALEDAMDQLISGSETLATSLGQLAQGGDALSGGITALREALGALPSGLTELKTGAQTVSEKLTEASAAAGQLTQGSSDVSDAAVLSLQELEAASAGLAQATSSVTSLGDAAEGLRLDDVNADIAKAAEVTAEAQTTTLDASAALEQAAQEACAQRDQVTTGLRSVQTALNDVLDDEALALTDEQRALLSERIGAVQEQVDGSLSDLEAMELDTPEEVVEAQATLAADAEALGGLAADIAQGSVDLSSLGTHAQDALSDLEGAAQSLGRAQGSVTMVAEGSKGVADGLTALSGGLSAIQTGSGALAEGIDALATKAPGALQGLDELQSGSNALATGLSAVTQGSGTLASGLAAFKQEGITKIVDTLTELDDSLEGVSGSLDALRDAAAEYDSFSGKADGQTGSVRFIYQTDGIGN